MRPTFLAFQTAHRAIATSQILLDTAGNNIANAQTEGYSRQRVDINSVSNGGAVQRFKPMNVTAGGGVEAKRVTRVRDQFLDARYRMQNSEDQKYTAVLNGLKDIENVVDQTMSDGLLAEIANFKLALDPMLENPPSNDMAMVVRNAAQKVASLLNTYAQHIEDVRDQQIFDLQSVYIDTDFNSTVQGIAALNKQINEEIAHGNTPNELLDERDLLFDKLSGLANVRITVTPQWLSSSLKVENVNVVIVDEKTGTEIDLIKNDVYNTLSVVKDETTGLARVNVNSAFGNEHLSDPNRYGNNVTPFLTGGTIGGALDIINGTGTDFLNSSPPENANAFRGTLYYAGMLDTFAANFARVLNELNYYNPNGVLPRSILVSSQDVGYDKSNANYNPLFDSSEATTEALLQQYTALYNTTVANYQSVLADFDTDSPYYDAQFDSSDTANATRIADAKAAYATLLVSNPVNTTAYDKNDPFYKEALDPSAAGFVTDEYQAIIDAHVPGPRNYLFSTIGDPPPVIVTAANIRVSQAWLDDPMYLTVTQPGDQSEGENIGRMIVAIEKGFAFHREGDTDNSAIFDGTLEEYFTGVNATLGLDVSLYQNYSDTSKHVMSTLFAARESVSGVSFDEEGVALMAYQKSYNAAVRFFTVLDEAVDRIINDMGLVGR
jgi:flagellar hook-associated protein FlgK